MPSTEATAPRASRSVWAGPYEGFDRTLSTSRYTRGRLLGKGAHALVYAALDERLQRPVALKVLKSPAPSLVRRLRAESRLLARVSHPRVVQIYEVGCWKERPTLVLEHVPGHDLRTALERLGAFPWRAGARILGELFEAVAHVHAAGIVHRDLKLQNVIRGSAGLRLIDFGLAEEVDDPSAITDSGFVVGTPYYRAPERGAGEAATPAADVFSLGVAAYRLLSGERPFEAENERTLAAVIRRSEPGPIAGLPGPLAAVIERALQKDPVMRYHSAASLHEAWRAALDELKRSRPTKRLHPAESV